MTVYAPGYLEHNVWDVDVPYAICGPQREITIVLQMIRDTASDVAADASADAGTRGEREDTGPDPGVEEANSP